jgi:hypothetical protein
MSAEHGLQLPAVWIELDAELAVDASTLREAVCAELAALANDLGLPGEPDVKIAAGGGRRAVRVLVGERVRPTSLALLRRTWLDVAPPELRGLPVEDESPDATADGWLRRFAAGPGAERGLVLERYIARLAAETLALNPAPLVTDAVTERYLMLAGVAQLPVTESRIALGTLVRLGVSLRDRESVGATLAECHEVLGGIENVVEELFARMAGQTLEIHAHPSAPGVAEGSSPLEATADVFAAAVRRHLHELGVTRDILVRPDDTLPEDHIRLRVNDRLGPPIPMPHPDEVVAQVSPLSLARHGIVGRALVDAASGHRLVAVPRTLETALRQARVQPLTPAEFMVVAAGREIATLAGRMLDINDVERDLADLELTDPKLVVAVLTRLGRARLTRVLRRLLEEQVSCRDLWTILNALLRYDSVPQPAPGIRVFDPRIAVARPGRDIQEASIDEVVAFVRRQMPERLAYDSGLRGEQLSASTLPVLRTDAGVDAWLHGRPAGEHDVGDDDFRWQAGRALGVAGTPADPVILTAPGSRAALRAVLADEFPTVHVLSTDEVPPGTAVDTRRVISLGT